VKDSNDCNTPSIKCFRTVGYKLQFCNINVISLNTILRTPVGY
jgi:hypothetical protein